MPTSNMQALEHQEGRKDRRPKDMQSIVDRWWAGMITLMQQLGR